MNRGSRKRGAPPPSKSRRQHITVFRGHAQFNGANVGYLLMRGAKPIAFVRNFDGKQGADQFAVARKLARGMRVESPRRGVVVDDLRRVELEGCYVGLPAFLLGLCFFPVDARGELIRTRGIDLFKFILQRLVTFGLTREEKPTVNALLPTAETDASFMAFHAADPTLLPTWHARRIAHEKTANHPNRIAPNLDRKGNTIPKRLAA